MAAEISIGSQSLRRLAGACLVVVFSTGGCSDKNTVTGPSPTRTPLRTATPIPPTAIPPTPTPAYPQIGGNAWTSTWNFCGVYVPPTRPPDPIHSGPPVFIQQNGPNFSVTIADLGLLRGMFAPKDAHGHAALLWNLDLAPPCSGSLSGAGGTDGSVVIIEMTTPGGSCPSCPNGSTGVIRLGPAY
jgi:hypothetical protein